MLRYWRYRLLAASVAIFFAIVLNILDQRLFFSPVIAFYIPKGELADFIVSTVIAILLAAVISSSIYGFISRKLQMKKDSLTTTSSTIIPASLVVISSVCVGCSLSASALVVSLLGTAGATTLTFLEWYQTPIRLLSVGLLIWSYYLLNKSLSFRNCNTKK